MINFIKDKRNEVIAVIAICLAIYLNWGHGQGKLSLTIAYSLPFFGISALIGYVISKLKKDKNFLLYSAITLSIFLLLDTQI